MSGNENIVTHNPQNEIHVNDGKRVIYLSGANITVLNPQKFSTVNTHINDTNFFGSTINVPYKLAYLTYLNGSGTNMNVYHLLYNRSELSSHPAIATFIPKLEKTNIYTYICPPHIDFEKQKITKTVIEGLGDGCYALAKHESEHNDHNQIVEVHGGVNILTYKPRNAGCSILLFKPSRTHIYVETHYPVSSITYEVESRGNKNLVIIGTNWQKSQRFFAKELLNKSHLLAIVYRQNTSIENVTLNFKIAKIDGQGVSIDKEFILKDLINSSSKKGVITLPSK